MLEPLRAHQHKMLLDAYRNFAGGVPSVLISAAPGVGKTHLAAHALRGEVSRGRRCVFLSGLDTITGDTFARLQRAGLDVGLIHADRPTRPEAPIQVCSWHTLIARGVFPEANLLLIDEVHHAQSDRLRALITSDAYKFARLLGLSATPERGDGQPLGDLFERLVQGPSIRWLQDRGYLVPYEVFEPVAASGTTADPVHAYFDFAAGSRAIVFTDRVETARELVARFEERGAPAAVLCADTESEERTAQRHRMRDGELKVICNVAVATEGYDLPSIETVILARSFGFVGTYLQAVGRGGRTSPETGKASCKVLDCAGNWRDHGLPDEDRVWQLHGVATRRTETMPTIAKCKQCGAIFRPTPHCPRCGAETAVQAEQVKRKLSRAETLLRVSGLPQWEQDARYLAKLRKVATERMRKSSSAADAWAFERFVITRKRPPTPRPPHAA